MILVNFDPLSYVNPNNYDASSKNYVSISGNQINWGVLGIPATGTILYTGAYPPFGYNTYPLVLFPPDVPGDPITQIVVVNTGTNKYYCNKYYTGSAIPLGGGGASFVYAQTGSSFQLMSVAGGGGANSQVIAPSNSFTGVPIHTFQGGSSQSNSTNNDLTFVTAPWSLSSQTLTLSSGSVGIGGAYNTGGQGGSFIPSNYAATGTLVPSTSGGSGMPLITSSVNSNLSCSGGNGGMLMPWLYVNSSNIYVDNFLAIFGAIAIYGGGGGRGFGGGGGGGLNYALNSISQAPYSCSGTVSGGAGGGNYSINGQTFYNFLNPTGSLTGSYGLSYSPGAVVITVTGKGNSACSLTSYTGSSTGSSFMFQANGSTLLPNSLTIGKTNTISAVSNHTSLDVQGDVNLIGNIQIPDYQTIFSSNSFNPGLNAILSNNFQNPAVNGNVSLNYTLAAMNLELGYIQNALAGLASMLGYAFGTYDSNGELADIPYWLKQYLANYLPLTTVSLSNYITARQTSLSPSLQYYINNGTILPFAQWCYNYVLNVSPNWLLSQQQGNYGGVGFYIENNNYYVFADGLGNNIYGVSVLPILANYYMVNSVFSTNNVNLIHEFNNPSGAYRFNYLADAYNFINPSYNVGITNLVMYNYNPNNASYYMENYYNPTSPLVQPTSTLYMNDYNLYGPTFQAYINYWLLKTYGNISVPYTGTYSSGTFVGLCRPASFYATPNPFTSQYASITGPLQSYKITEAEQAKSISFIKDFRAVSSNSATTLSQVTQVTGQVTLTSSSTVATITSIKTNANGPVTTSVSSTQSTVGTNNNTSMQNITRGVLR